MFLTLGDWQSMTRTTSQLGQRHDATAGGGLARVLQFVRKHLSLDLVCITELAERGHLYRAFDGDAESFGMIVDAGPVLPEPVCQLMGQGTTPCVIPDTAADTRLNGLSSTWRDRVGAYIGVPLRLADGQLYGTLSGLSHAARPLDERDVALMMMLGEMLAEQLERASTAQRKREDVEQALSSGAITMAMQPIIGLADGRCVGVEALARFPALNLAPDVLFEQAYEAGLAAELELAAVRAALAQRRHLPAALYLSVNIGPTGIMAAGFAAAVRSGGPLDGLVLEITEHLSVAEYAALSQVLAPLRADGMRLAVDDVGAGYASLRHVLRMRPDIIKIDRSLIDGIAGDVAQRSIVTSIVLLSLDLGAQIVAEGVERPADASALADLGVDLVQGYLFAAPTTDRRRWHDWDRVWTLPINPVPVARSMRPQVTHAQP